MFAQSTITQALGQTTRVGIVTYGQKAVVVSLTKIHFSIWHNFSNNEENLQQYGLTAFNDTNTFINTIFTVASNPTTDTVSYIYT